MHEELCLTVHTCSSAGVLEPSSPATMEAKAHMARRPLILYSTGVSRKQCMHNVAQLKIQGFASFRSTGTDQTQLRLTCPVLWGAKYMSGFWCLDYHVRMPWPIQCKQQAWPACPLLCSKTRGHACCNT